MKLGIRYTIALTPTTVECLITDLVEIDGIDWAVFFRMIIYRMPFDKYEKHFISLN